jgi:Tfp pilus assembly protein PilP
MRRVTISVICGMCLAAFLNCGSAWGTEKRTKLELQSYDQMVLVGIKKKSNEWLACFKIADGTYETARIGSQVGTSRASITSFANEYILVLQPLVVNGHEWVDSEFSWPISELADKNKWPCKT